MNYLALDSVPVSSPAGSRHAVSMCSQALLIELSSHGRKNPALVYIYRKNNSDEGTLRLDNNSRTVNILLITTSTAYFRHADGENVFELWDETRNSTRPKMPVAGKRGIFYRIF